MSDNNWNDGISYNEFKDYMKNVNELEIDLLKELYDKYKINLYKVNKDRKEIVLVPLEDGKFEDIKANQYIYIPYGRYNNANEALKRYITRLHDRDLASINFINDKSYKIKKYNNNIDKDKYDDITSSMCIIKYYDKDGDECIGIGRSDGYDYYLIIDNDSFKTLSHDSVISHYKIDSRYDNLINTLLNSNSLNPQVYFTTNHASNNTVKENPVNSHNPSKVTLDYKSSADTWVESVRQFERLMYYAITDKAIDISRVCALVIPPHIDFNSATDVKLYGTVIAAKIATSGMINFTFNKSPSSNKIFGLNDYGGIYSPEYKARYEFDTDSLVLTIKIEEGEVYKIVTVI